MIRLACAMSPQNIMMPCGTMRLRGALVEVTIALTLGLPIDTIVSMTSWDPGRVTSANDIGNVSILFMWHSPNDKSVDQCVLQVDDVGCLQYVFSNCEGRSLGFVANCTNQGYASKIDSCRGEKGRKNSNSSSSDLTFSWNTSKVDLWSLIIHRQPLVQL